MTELQRLLSACDEQLNQGRQCALATVVQVEGSAYRRPGARMLITDTGHLTGTISGGCLEGDARRRALQVIQRGKPEIVVYDSLDLDDDMEHGAQLGCQGLVHVLIEPLKASDDKTVELLRAASRQFIPTMLLTVLKSDDTTIKTGAALLVTHDYILGDIIADEHLKTILITEARSLLNERSSLVKDVNIDGNQLSIFFERIEPAAKLTIYGAGNDVQPLLKMAINVGWQVTVVDGRMNLVTAERFMQATYVKCIKADELRDHTNNNGFAVLMSHNYVYDLNVLRSLYHQPNVKYIGLLGPRKKAVRMLDELREEGLIITDEFESRLFGPVGINIGAEAAEEIALAIMAELVAIRNGHPAGFLRDLDGPIHKTTNKALYHAP